MSLYVVEVCMSDVVLKATGIQKSFGGVHALKGVDLEIGHAEIHCLAGENGSGKSTLIKIISGVHPPDAGSIEFMGKKLSHLNPAEAIKLGIQVIYQDFSVFPNLTVMENLALNKELMENKKFINYRRAREIAAEAVAKIGFSIDLDERVENLSVADKQLIAISRALLQDAKLIIMDEPTSALTKKEVKSLFSVIKQLQAEGISILFVSHKLDEVFEISDRFTIIRSGELIASGSTKGLDRKKFIYYMTGREFSEEFYSRPPADNKPVLSVRNLTLKGVYSDISFDLYPNEILGITGLLGSGRTELAETLFGILQPDSGTIELKQKKVKIRIVQDAIENGIGYVPEDRLTQGLFLSQAINRNIVVSTLEKISSRIGVLNLPKFNETTEKWIRALSIVATNAALPVKTLSGGNQQKVVLARWLARDLSVLILNCPTMGVDIGAKYDIHALIRKLAAEGLAIILVSDDLPEVLACSSRIIVMREGRFVEEMNASETTEQMLSELTVGIA